MNEENIRVVTQKIVEGISYLHKQNIVHRNLKSSNILIDKEISVKITEPLLTKYYKDSSEEIKTTYRFRAPETFHGCFQYSSDIWSIGCLVIHMLTGEPPYLKLDEEEVCLKLTRNNAFPAENLPDNISVTLKILIYSVLEKTPELRPTANSISSEDAFISERYISKEIPNLWKRGELLGRGQYGKVFQVIDEKQPLEIKFVVKDIKLTLQGKRNISLETKNLFRREAEILLILEDHERIVPFYGFVSSQNTISIFLGYMALGSLYHYYEANGPVTEEKCCLYTRQILEGLVFLHDLNIVHRDVKGLNVLLETEEKIRLTDFGISECINDEINNGKHGIKADIWSLGCTVVEMLTGKVPYHKISFNGRVIFKVGKGEPPEYPDNLSGELKEFLNESFVVNPNMRKSSKEMLDLSFVKTATAENLNPVRSELNENVINEATKVEWIPVKNDLIHHFQHQLIELISKHNYFDGDLDVETAFQRKLCTRNPGHKKFIPVGKFQMKHLPANVQNPLVYEFIKATADLTVEIDVKKKEHFMRTGSGLIYEIEKYVADVASNRSITLCPCHRCQSLDKPSNTWFRVKIITSAHIILDDTEAWLVSCRLFYDPPDSLGFQLRMSKIHEVNVLKDISFLECVSCDKDMLDRAMTSLQYFDDLRYKVYNKYKRYKDIYKMVFIVSHPHGGPKCVSIGEWVNKIVVDGDSSWATFHYTTCACPGSAGAYVHILGYSGRVWHYPHVHSAGSIDINTSNCGFIIK